MVYRLLHCVGLVALRIRHFRIIDICLKMFMFDIGNPVRAYVWLLSGALIVTALSRKCRITV